MIDFAAGQVTWTKSSSSVACNACVEVARIGDRIALRDSKNPGVAPFYYTHAEFDAFLDGAKQGEFDHLLSMPRSPESTQAMWELGT